MSSLTAQKLIQHLGLEPLSFEGGLYKQSYRAADVIKQACLSRRYQGDKPAGTAIYYLLTNQPDSFSALHALPTDEIHHFYLGDPVELLLLYPDRTAKMITLGQDLFNGQHVQFVVPAGVWQGSRLIPGGSFALMGNTMAPGFTDEDFQPAERENLQAQYPQFAELIEELTRI